MTITGMNLDFKWAGPIEPAPDDPDKNTIVLGNGSRIKSYGNVVGIDENGFLTEGYDNGFYDEDLPTEDKIALADLMIARWEAYKAKAVNGESDEHF